MFIIAKVRISERNAKFYLSKFLSERKYLNGIAVKVRISERNAKSQRANVEKTCLLYTERGRDSAE